MTATMPRPQASARDSVREALRTRLVHLRADRATLLAETTPEGSGDSADRATNVDAHIRLAMLEDRIAHIEEQLSMAAPVAADGAVVEGSTVVLDFGDGPETYLVAPVEQAGVGLEVVTPSSPLGRALLGATEGQQLTYSPRSGRQLQVTLVSVA